MPAKKTEAEKEAEKAKFRQDTEKDDIRAEKEDELEEFDEDEDEEDEYEEEYDTEIETEIEHQTPEVIAKELLITYLETNAFAQPDPLPGENRYQAIGRAIGEMYNALLEEILK
jgi:hypothetical protein